MKLYIKDGIIKNRNQIVIHKDGMNVFNPSEEMILADGWSEYVKPELTIDDFKKMKRDEILRYDSSEEVNQFCMQEHGIWLDKATRAGLMLRLQAEQAIGKSNTTLWYANMQFEIPIESAFQMLYALEVYASQCYDNTQRHLANIDNLDTKEEIESYDYRVGYPPLLEF